MKDTNKTMDNLLDTCKLFAAAILVVVLLFAFAGCEKGRADNTPTQTIPSTQQTTQPETTQAPTIKETTPAVETAPAAETTASTEHGRSSLKRACWRTTASRRNTTKIWATAFIRSM